MPDAKTLNARCGTCGHVWPVANLPQSLSSVAKLCKAARCPNGCGGKVFLAGKDDKPHA